MTEAKSEAGVVPRYAQAQARWRLYFITIGAIYTAGLYFNDTITFSIYGLYLAWSWFAISFRRAHYLLDVETAHSNCHCIRDASTGRVGRTYWLSSSVQINCTCARLVQKIKELNQILGVIDERSK